MEQTSTFDKKEEAPEIGEMPFEQSEATLESGEALPEQSDVVAENNAMLPEKNDEVTPENDEALPEQNQAVLENSEELPEKNEAVPEKSVGSSDKKESFSMKISEALNKLSNNKVSKAFSVASCAAFTLAAGVALETSRGADFNISKVDGQAIMVPATSVTRNTQGMGQIAVETIPSGAVKLYDIFPSNPSPEVGKCYTYTISNRFLTKDIVRQMDEIPCP